MNWYRIGALIQRNIILNYRGIDPLIDIFYWPSYDIMLWGFTSLSVAHCQKGSIALQWLTALCIWQVCYRVNLDVCLNLLIEIWSRNVVNLFATPLEIKEWIVAAIGLGLFNALVSLLYSSIIIGLLYQVNIFSIGWIIVPLLLLLMLSGWVLGFISAGFLIISGQKVQKIVWVQAWFFVPFSALFYTLGVLPSWAVAIAKLVPMSYVFEGLRVFFAQGTFPLYNFAMSLALNCLYLTLALTFFIAMFYKSKSRGLARLEQE